MTLRYILFCFLVFLFGVPVFAQKPIEFVENRGQWGTWFNYKAATQAGDVCLEKDGFRYVLKDPDNNFKMDYYHHGQTKVKPTLKFHVYKMTFEGASEPVFESERPYKVYYNYFLGNDSSKWKTGIHPSRSVNYKGLYSGIDLHVTSDMGNIVYDFIVAPNADVSKIKLRFDGQDKISIQENNLVINTSVGYMTEMKPIAYQFINGDKVMVECRYVLDENKVSFDFPNGYNNKYRLILDPTVIFCTMTGSTADNWGFTATYDDAGNFYAGGLVNDFAYAGTSFPFSPGAFQTTFGGGLTYVDPGTGQLWAYAADISIIKYDPTLTSRIYATYLGGAGNDHAHSMVVDPSENLIIDGRTASTNYPVSSTAYQSTYRGKWDIVVTKFNAAGTGLIGSTYIGGSAEDGVNFDSTEYGYGELKYNYGDDARSEVLIDKFGNIFVAGCTSSNDFPTTTSAISTSLSGLQDGVVFKMNSTLSSLIWSTYITGNGSDAAYVLAFDNAHNSVYVAGGTNSTTFPTTAGTLFSGYQGGIADGFVLKFRNAPPYNLLNGTYIGMGGYDQVYGIQVSSATDEVYVMGQTLGGTFPVSSGVYSNPGSSQFVMKMDNNLTTNLLSTVFGSGGSTLTNISPTAFLVDTCENVYVSGWGGNLGIPGIPSGECHGMPTSPDATQSTTDGRDFYFIVLAPGMASLKYATYYGRNCPVPFEGEHVDGGTSRFSKHGIIYQGICANCGGTPATNPSACPSVFPTTPGVWSEVDSSRNCNQAALKINFNIGPVNVDITAGPTTNGCAPLPVNFYNHTVNGLSFVWDFGDGSPTVTGFEPTHTFTAGGTYTVTLAAANSNACFTTDDTAYIVITVDTNKLNPDFTYVVTDSCGPYAATFTNTSTTNIVSATPPSYTWLLGDGSTYTGETPPPHSYADEGTYTVTLIMSHPDACKSPDTVSKDINIFGKRVSASFEAPDTLCFGLGFKVTSSATNATSVVWTFEDTVTSTEVSPSYIFKAPGTYKVKMVAINPGACNGMDSMERSITILPAPTANFSFIPVQPEPNIPTTFTNLSLNATRYSWDFGDDTYSEEVNPVHQFKKTDNYTVCLTAYNNSDCPSVACKSVPSEVVPLIGLPTGFSPNGDGQNDILYIRGAAIETVDLKIYNRWGELVFHTTSQEIGWNGTYNGQPQPIEAYGYVLRVTFIDGTAKLLKGNITLLR